MTGTAPESAAQAEQASASDDGRLLFRRVSIEVPRGSAVALLGQRTASGAFLECLAGKRRVVEGRMQVLGLDPLRRWRLRGRRVFLPAGSVLAPLRSTPELILCDVPREISAEFKNWMRERTATGMAVLVASEHPTRISALVDQAALFSRGRLVAEGALARIVERFRRLRFVNRLTETRTAFGTELDEFDAVRVRVRGWGIEAVIANFDELAFERLRGRDGVFDAEAEPMTLAEIAEACAEGA